MKKSNELINIHNASVTYKNGHIGLLNASCKIFSSSITGLVGINGAGKSTLFKAIMGFVPLSSGKISVFDYSVEQALKSCKDKEIGHKHTERMNCMIDATAHA